MKIYLCKKCGKTIPLDQLTDHQKECGPGSEIEIKRGWGAKFGGVFKAIFMLVFAVILVGGGIVLGQISFRSIASMRQLERIPATVISAALPGEINLTGRAEKYSNTIKGPKSGSSCLYYRYMVEREERDSDGDTHWSTIEERSDAVEFQLNDDSDVIRVNPVGDIDFNVKRSFRTQSGDLRYTEWRIDPGNKVFLFGYVVSDREGLQVRFDREGHYDPIISEYSEARERLSMAGISIGLCWGGLVALAFGVALFIGLVRMHRLLVYFTILGLIVMTDLVVLGLNMMKIDLQASAERLGSHETSAIEAIKPELEKAGTQWDGDWASLGSFEQYRSHKFKAKTANRLRRIRLDYALAVERASMQRYAFPERMLAPIWGVGSIEAVFLPEDQQAELAKLSAEFQKAKVPTVIGWSIIGVALVLGIIAFGVGFRRVRFKRCIENLPTSPAAGAAYGLTELKGFVAIPDLQEPIMSPLTLTPCVQYHYVVKEKRGSGKNSSWVTVINETHERPFLLRDSTGEMLVDPTGAKVMTMHSSSRSQGRRSYSETRLEVDDPVYAIGECVIEPSRGETLYLKKPEGDYPFILANYVENVIMRKIAFAGMLLLNVSFAALLLMTLTLFGLSGSFAATDYLASALAAPIFMTIVTLALHYNDLVFLRERANRNWSNIDVSLQKRSDLVPMLEKVVKSYMEHESGLQEAIAKMRSSYPGKADDTEAVSEYMQNEYAALGQVLAVYENYPELKADQTASQMMRTMVTLENEIAFMRNGYNDAVETYNTRIQTMPDLVFAKMFRFTDKKWIAAETEAVKMPPSLQNVFESRTIHLPTAEEKAGGAPAQAGEAGGPGGMSAALATAAAVTPDADGRMPEDMTEEATDGRAVIYALLLADDEALQSSQLDTIEKKDSKVVRDKTASLVEAVAKQITDQVKRLQEAEGWFDKIQTLSAGGYRSFTTVVRELVEADADIDLFEYTLMKSITRTLDPRFGMAEERPERHKDMSLITGQASLVLSRLAYAEEAPDDTSQAAFDIGVSQLNHEPKSDITLVPFDQCGIASFDAALEEIAHSVPMVKANFQLACEKAVQMDDDYTYDQALLLISIADTFNRDRPNWVFE